MQRRAPRAHVYMTKDSREKKKNRHRSVHPLVLADRISNFCWNGCLDEYLSCHQYLKKFLSEGISERGAGDHETSEAGRCSVDADNQCTSAPCWQSKLHLVIVQVYTRCVRVRGFFLFPICICNGVCSVENRVPAGDSTRTSAAAIYIPTPVSTIIAI